MEKKKKQLIIISGLFILIILLVLALESPILVLNLPSNNTYYNTSSFSLICNYTAASIDTLYTIQNISAYHDFSGSFVQNITYNTYDNWYFTVTDPAVGGLYYNGTNFWILSKTNTQIKRYNGTGVYDNWYLNTSAQSLFPKGFTYNGSNFWVVDSTSGKVFRYNITGGYDNWYFNTSSEFGSPQDIFYNGTYFWIATDDWIPPRIFRYQSDGTYDNYYFILGSSAIISPSSFSYNGSKWWVGDYGYALVARFQPEGVYDNWSMWLKPQDYYVGAGDYEGDVEGVSVYGDYIYIYGNINDRVYRFTHYSSEAGAVNYTYSSISDGTYHWNCMATLWNNTKGSASSNLTIIVDTTNPLIFHVSPTPTNLTAVRLPYVLINYSYSDTNLNSSYDSTPTESSLSTGSADAECPWVIYQNSSQTNAINNACIFNTHTYTATYMFINYTFSEGETRYGYYAITSDYAKNRNQTNTQLFYYDPTAPKLSIQSPQSIVYIFNTSLQLNYVANDTRWEFFNNATSGLDYAQTNTTSAYISQVWYNLDGGANITLSGNTLFNTTNGTHILYIFTNDTVGNVQTSSVSFTIAQDSSVPVVVLDYPTNGTWYNSNSILFNYTATDANLSSCFLYGDFDGTWGQNQSSTLLLNGTSNVWAAVTLNTGTYHWNTICNDTTANTASGLSNYTFFVDTIFPLFYNESHSPTTMYNNNSLVINITTIESNIHSVWLEINNSGSWKNHTMLGVYPFYTFNLSAGNFSNRMNITFRIHANDTAGNYNQSQFYNLFVINRAPGTISVITTNGTLYGTTQVVLNITSIDPDSDSLTYHFWQNNGTYIGASTASNYTWSGLTAEGTYYWYAFATDGYLNTTNIDNQSFTLDFVYPNITLSSPANASTTTSLTPLLTYAVADNGAYTSCWYSASYYPSNVLIVENTSLTVCNSTLTSYSLSLPTYTQYILNFYVNDSANNINSTRKFFTIQQASGDSGGGGPSSTPTPISSTNETAQPVFCGDKVCSPSEDLINCPIDCPLNFDTLGETLQQAWFAKFAFFFIIGAIFYMAYFDGLGKSGNQLFKKIKKEFRQRK